MREHKHLILRGYLGRPVLSAEDLTDTLKELVELIGMKILAEPRARYCYELGNEGFTGDVLLTTSHMIWHDWETEDENDFGTILQLDIYSCADFSVKAVIDYLKEMFELKEYSYKLFDRSYAIIEDHTGSYGRVDLRV